MRWRVRCSDERGAAHVHVRLHAGQLSRDGVERADEPEMADGLHAQAALLRVGGGEQQRGAEEALGRDLVFWGVCWNKENTELFTSSAFDMEGSSYAAFICR